MTSPLHSQSSSTINSVHTFVSGQRSSVRPFQNSSPISLTVSPSLKTPSFLGQSGTYSFRICPPANQSAKGQNPPGVILPGGFTLIQLPKHGADREQSESVNAANMAVVDKAPPPQDALLSSAQAAADSEANWLGLNTSYRAKELGSVPGVTCDEKMPSVESDEANIRQADSQLDTASDDLSSESSDSCDNDVSVRMNCFYVQLKHFCLQINYLKCEVKCKYQNIYRCFPSGVGGGHRDCRRSKTRNGHQ